MARVKLTITCEQCGQEFQHIRFLRNSREAEKYEAWARANVTICPACHAAGERARRWAEAESYLTSFGDEIPQLPKITGVSEKQVAYAEALRSEYLFQKVFRLRIDLPRFFRAAGKFRLDRLGPADRAKVDALAGKEGKSPEAWFAAHRGAVLAREASLSSAETASKIELLFTESSASRIIDALR